MFRGADALKMLEGKRQGFLIFDDVTITQKKENCAKPKEGQEPSINMHLKQSRSFVDRT